MRFSKNTGCFYPKSENYHNLPDDIIEVPQAAYEAAANRSQDEVLDVVNGELVIVQKIVPLDELKADKFAEIETARNNAIVQPISSSALGAPHTYSAKSENRNFLNNLITLGNGSKFTCTDANGVKQRRLHTNAQLIALGNDFEVHITAQFDSYEQKIAEIAAAQNAEELANIYW